MEVRPLAELDRSWAASLCHRRFGSATLVALGRTWEPALLPGLVAWEEDRRVGVVSFAEEPGGAEVVLLAVEHPGHGAGTALLDGLVSLGRARGWERLRLLTTNDNTDALAFYRRRGWELKTLHRGAVDRDRRLKPEIPAIGAGGIPIRDLWELELRLPTAGERG